MLKKFKLIEQYIVDGDPWYTVICSRTAAKWVRQYSDRCFEIHEYLFDIPEDVYVLMKLKWNE